MSLSHFFLALIVVVAWGLNFIFVKLGLDEVSPLFLCALRFLLASVPLIFFIKPPKAPFKLVALYGLVMFAMQFSLIFMGMNAGIAPGLASILTQVQVFFSIFFAMMFIREVPGLWQIVGALCAFCGIGVVAMHLDGNVTLTGFVLIMAASASWGLGNLITKKLGPVNVMSLIAWGSLIAFFPLLLLSLIFEGKDQIISSMQNISWVGISAIFYIVYISTWVGYGVWNWLLNRHSVPTIAPFSLLIPVVAIFSSVLFLDESFEFWKLTAGFLVITGLGINLLAPRFFAKKNLATRVE